MPVNFNINNLFGQLGKGWTIVFILIIIAGVFFYFTKSTTVKPQDCSKCEADKKALVDIMLEFKNDFKKLASPNETSFIEEPQNKSPFIFASFIDTIPKKKDTVRKKVSLITIRQQQQAQVQIAIKDYKKIDSILKVMQQQQSQKPKQ